MGRAIRSSRHCHVYLGDFLKAAGSVSGCDTLELEERPGPDGDNVLEPQYSTCRLAVVLVGMVAHREPP